MLIDGFQTHKNLALEFSSGVTTIVGPSDVGKSAVIRAIRWVACNEPSGDAFISWDSNRACVTITVDGGKIVLRERGPSNNTYEIQGSNGKSCVYRSFGNGVPLKVLTILQLQPINFQGQYDGPFWLSATAGDVSRQLNQVVNLEVIDQVLAKLAGLVKKRTSEVDVSADRAEKIKTEGMKWRFAKSMNEALIKIEELASTEETIRCNVTQLDTLVNAGLEVCGELVRLTAIVVPGEILVALGNEAESQCQRVEDLGELIFHAQHSKEASELCISDQAFLALENELGGLSFEKILSDAGELNGLIVRAIDERNSVLDTKLKFESASKRWIQEMGNVCQLC